MAKIKKVSKGIKIKGKSTSQLLKMDIYKLKAPSLRQVVNRLISTANKRLVRLKEKAPNSRALSYHLDENGNIIKFSLKDAKTRNEVEMVMKDVKNFLTSKTSTIKGFEEVRSDVERRIGEFESIEEENKFWKTYNEWVDKHPNLSARFNDSNTLVSMMYDEFIVKGKSKRSSKYNVTKAINKMLKEQNISKAMEESLIEKGLKQPNAIRFGRKDI